MKTKLLVTLIVLMSLTQTTLAAPSVNTPSSAEKVYKFKFNSPKAKPFTIEQKASSEDIAYKLAASSCYKKLTGDKYPGEQKGLEIIDICANPKI